MNNNTTYDDDYLLEMAEEMVDEQPSVIKSDNPSPSTDLSPKDDLDHTNADASVKLHQNSLISSNKEEDMSTINERHILSPITPRVSAGIFIDYFHRYQGMQTIQCVPSTGEFFIWRNNYYQPISDLALQSEIQNFLHNAVRHIPAKGNEPEGYLPFNTESAKELKVLNALKCITCSGIAKDPAIAPTWIHSLNIDSLPNPESIVPFKNKLLSIDDFLKTGIAATSLHSVTPKFFCSTQIPFEIHASDHDPISKRSPMRFIAFLNEVFNGDQSSILFLQQWFGYCLTNMTHLQKMLLIVGPKRSGKGTIGRVLQAMLGIENTIAPSASAMLAANGMEPWLGKKLAVFGDARFGDKIDKDAVKEFLLQISGEDTLTIGRKFKCAVSTQLKTKIMVLSNEVPEFIDSGAALASRFIILKMENSVIGKENTGLFEKELKPEIPLIFWWALDGLRSLMASNRFVQPEGGKATVVQMERNQSPVGAFVSDFCNVRPGISIPKEVLYAGYERWCIGEDMKPLNRVYFGRYLLSAAHTVKAVRSGNDGSRVQSFDGISLKDRS